MDLKIQIPKAPSCNKCRKRPLISVDCRCGLTFCMAHRMPEDHECCFNHREYGQRILRDANPVVVGQKVDKV